MAAADVSNDPAAAAAQASLRYVSDARPGITRHRSGRGFTYRDSRGARITDTSTLERIASLVIPPAWTDVWICPTANGHVQATGRDARGRKQHRYHPRWREVRDESKYARLAAFARSLPVIRRAVAADLSRPGMPREKVLALLVWFLETTYVRIGNEEYARTNGSYGLTTLTNKHVQVQGTNVRLRFTGKSGKPHDIRLTNRRIASIVRRLRELPGQELFQYVDAEGEAHPLDSSDVNAYLRDISGIDVTAKDFRTWAGTLLAARQVGDDAAEAATSAPTVREAKAATAAAVKAVAAELRNTPAVCRKCYIHPRVLQMWTDPDQATAWRALRAKPPKIEGLEPEEAALTALLEREQDKAA
jgi:DNA topoisomerase I